MMLKTAITLQPSWENGLQVLYEGSRDDDAYLQHPMMTWMSQCAVVKLGSINNKWRPILKECSHTDNLNNYLYGKLLNMMHPFDIEKEFTRQFSRWAATDDAEVFAKRAKCLLDVIQTHIPPCVLFCLIATWCNGWCTSRRF